VDDEDENEEEDDDDKFTGARVATAEVGMTGVGPAKRAQPFKRKVNRRKRIRRRFIWLLFLLFRIIHGGKL
jgi:hypothetical protein